MKEKKKEEKVDRADGDRRKYTFSFPVRTLKFELEKKKELFEVEPRKMMSGRTFGKRKLQGSAKKKLWR